MWLSPARVVERLGRVILHGDDHVVLRRHLLLLVADVGDGQGLSGLHAEREVTVQVGHGTIARSVDQHAREKYDYTIIY